VDDVDAPPPPPVEPGGASAELNAASSFERASALEIPSFAATTAAKLAASDAATSDADAPASSIFLILAASAVTFVVLAALGPEAGADAALATEPVPSCPASATRKSSPVSPAGLAAAAAAEEDASDDDGSRLRIDGVIATLRSGATGRERTHDAYRSFRHFPAEREVRSRTATPNGDRGHLTWTKRNLDG